jgi:hypothetical protein
VVDDDLVAANAHHRGCLVDQLLQARGVEARAIERQVLELLRIGEATGPLPAKHGAVFLWELP